MIIKYGIEIQGLGELWKIKKKRNGLVRTKKFDIDTPTNVVLLTFLSISIALMSVIGIPLIGAWSRAHISDGIVIITGAFLTFVFIQTSIVLLYILSLRVMTGLIRESIKVWSIASMVMFFVAIYTILYPTSFLVWFVIRIYLLILFGILILFSAFFIQLIIRK